MKSCGTITNRLRHFDKCARVGLEDTSEQLANKAQELGRALFAQTTGQTAGNEESATNHLHSMRRSASFSRELGFRPAGAGLALVSPGKLFELQKIWDASKTGKHVGLLVDKSSAGLTTMTPSKLSQLRKIWQDAPPVHSRRSITPDPTRSGV